MGLEVKEVEGRRFRTWILNTKETRLTKEEGRTRSLTTEPQRHGEKPGRERRERMQHEQAERAEAIEGRASWMPALQDGTG